MPKPKQTDLLAPGPGRRDVTARRFNQNLAIVAREAVPAGVMMEYLLAIMEGHGSAVLKRDERYDGGWCVTWPEKGELSSTPEQKQWAWTQWRQAGYGMPVQSITLDAELRATYQQGPTLELGAMTPAQLIAIRKALLPPAPVTDTSDAIDAEIVSETQAPPPSSEPSEP